MKFEIKTFEGVGTISVDDELNVLVNDEIKARVDYVSNGIIYLAASKIKNQKGAVNGIRVTDEIANKVFILVRDIKAKENAEHDAKVAADTEKAMKANIVSYEYESGCDTSDTSRFKYDYDNSICYEAQRARDAKDKKVLDTIANFSAEKFLYFLELGSVEELEAAPFSYGGFKTSDKKVIDALIEEAKKIIAKEDEAKKVKADEKASKEKAAFEKAKATGQPQQLGMYTVDCDESVEDCSWDNIITYAMPNGTTQTRRVHTY